MKSVAEVDSRVILVATLTDRREKARVFDGRCVEPIAKLTCTPWRIEAGVSAQRYGRRRERAGAPRDSARAFARVIKPGTK